jgi:ABC-type branched-subunit amino acid transport system permease subunit
LRTLGASLAIITLACGLAIEEIFFNRTGWFGLAETRKSTGPPELFGLEFGPTSGFFMGDGKLPTAGFSVFLLVVCIAACIAVMRLRRSRLGEQMLAVRANERAAAAAGVNVRAVKLTAFAIASALAGLAGSLTAFKLGSYSADSFGIFASLTLLAFAYLGGISTVGGAVMASTLVAEGIGIVVTNEILYDVGAYTAYIAGFFLIATAIYNNEGIDGFQRAQFYSIVNRYRSRGNADPIGEVATSP